MPVLGTKLHVPSSAAPVIICVPRAGLVVNAASSGACAFSLAGWRGSMRRGGGYGWEP
jgi:hypothetical protein